MRHYCTYFDRNYLVRALALIESLQRHEREPFCLHAVCLDDEALELVRRLGLPEVDAIPLSAIEAGDERLLATKQERSIVEYYWTATPTVILRILERDPSIEILTYLDSDLYFYSSPDPIFAELGDCSVLIHEHRFSPAHAYQLATSGRFNVGLLCFRNDAQGREVLGWWRERCLEWCYSHYEDGKYGDQLYLADWPTRFTGIRVLHHLGGGVAPWNQEWYDFSGGAAGPLVNGVPLIFYHFHSLTFLGPDTFLPAKSSYYRYTVPLLREVVLPYLDGLQRAIARLKALEPAFSAGLGAWSEPDRDMIVLRHRNAPGLDRPSIDLGDWRCYGSQQLPAFMGAVVWRDPGLVVREPRWLFRQLRLLGKRTVGTIARAWLGRGAENRPGSKRAAIDQAAASGT